MAAHEENFQSLRVCAEKEANFQARPAFKDIPSQPANGNSSMEVRLAKAVGQHSQRIFHPGHVHIAQVLERGEKARTKQQGEFTHVSAFQ